MLDRRIGPDPDVHAIGEFLDGLEDPALGFEVLEPSVRDQLALSVRQPSTQERFRADALYEDDGRPEASGEPPYLISEAALTERGVGDG